MKCLFISTAIVIGLVLFISSAAVTAQSQPTPSPTPLPDVPIALPSQAPSGWTQRTWDETRARCQELADKVAAHPYAPPSSQDISTGQVCRSLSWGLRQSTEPAEESPQPQFHNSPLPTPAPSASSFDVPAATGSDRDDRYRPYFRSSVASPNSRVSGFRIERKLPS